MYYEINDKFWGNIVYDGIEDFSVFYKKLSKKDKKQIVDMLLGVHPLIKSNEAIRFFYESGMIYKALKINNAIEDGQVSKFTSNEIINGEISLPQVYKNVFYFDLYNIAKITGFSNFKNFNILRFNFETYEGVQLTLDFCHLFEISSKRFKNYMIQTKSEYLTISFVLMQDYVVEHYLISNNIKQRMYLSNIFYHSIYFDIENIHFYIPQNVKVYLANFINFGLYSHHIQKWCNSTKILMKGEETNIVLYNNSNIVSDQARYFIIEKRKEIVAYDESK